MRVKIKSPKINLPRIVLILIIGLSLSSCATDNTRTNETLLKKYEAQTASTTTSSEIDVMNSGIVTNPETTTTDTSAVNKPGGTSSSSINKAERLNLVLSEKHLMYKGSMKIGDYKVGPEDLLEIRVFEVKELNTVARVSARGFIKLPLIGKIEADGLTVSELEGVIAKKLEKFLTDPVVSVFVKEFRSQPITVIGSVKKPQVYYVQGQRYLLDMISLAGGLSADAGDVCIIQRPVKKEEEQVKYEKIVVDLNQLLINGRAELNIPLESGDIIHIPKAGVFFVDGAVGNPGSFQLKGKITLTQALSMAKGLTYDAIRSDIRIYRDTGKKEREVISVDYDSILDGESPDIPIEDKDIILVSNSGFKRFVRRLTTSFSLGIFRLGAGF